MATPAAQLAPQEERLGLDPETNGSTLEDPFVTSGQYSQQHPHPHRYSAFDTQLLDLNATSSPSQVKRTLEAHLAETDRRLQDASKLGTTLVQQRKELAEKLKEIERQQDEGEITPELRQRLAELEKEYNEVGRESARAVLAPRSRVASAEEKPGPDGQVPASPAMFSSQATASPSKVTVPARKQRNQPSSRVGDIQFAADISTSLLAQVRQLQAVLAERDEALKSLNLEKSRLELEAEGFSQRLRALDESEQRYKDENWNLETQTHELMASVKDASDREKRLNASLSTTMAEKTKVQGELDELKLTNSKLAEDHSAAQKAHDSELHTLHRTLNTGDNERLALQRKVDELTSQNQELAKAVAARLRGRDSETDRDLGSEQEEMMQDLSTPEQSPPPSPSKATPRHGMLESETLKSSLHHAHRMIQNLKSNIHREKTEKIELKRMLQEARDELELRRHDTSGPGSGSKRQKTKSEAFKKPMRSDILGAGRKSRTAIEIEDPDWEDHVGEGSPSQAAAASRYLQVGSGDRSGRTTDLSDAYQTANETEEFETANERESESDAFHTGAESIAGESTDELTETEDRVERGGTVRAKKPRAMPGEIAGDRTSFVSTASTSAGEEEEDAELRTPVQSQPQKYRLKLNRVLGSRRSRNLGEVGIHPNSNQSSVNNSPANFASDRSPPAQDGQSLFAELGDLNGGVSDGEFSTPGRASIASAKSTPLQHSASRKSLVDTENAEPTRSVPAMVDTGMMTEPWQPSTAQELETPQRRTVGEHPPPEAFAFPLPPSHPASPGVIDSSTQYTPQKSLHSPERNTALHITPPKTIWDEQQETTSSEPSINRSAVPEPPQLGLSQVLSQAIEPLSPPINASSAAQLSLSPIRALETLPVGLKSEDKVTTTGEARLRTAEGFDNKSGILGSVFAWGKQKVTSQAEIAEDETVQLHNTTQEASNSKEMPLKDVSGNTSHEALDVPLAKADMNHQGSQTILTSDQIDRALLDKATKPSAEFLEQKSSPPTPVVVTPRPSRSRSSAASPDATTLQQSSQNPPAVALPTTPKRPSSASSQRLSVSSNHPPLPPDHKQAIVAAGGRLSSADGSVGVMGPPIAPASAYRRPRTPSNDQYLQSPSSRTGTTPRPRGRHGSQISRRSSVSSFASELDERFNIRVDALPQGIEPGTDPRMISAITQTMIGEFLWKYTRKPGRGDMSSTRHRRYFWVHPYTRTLYWSDQDPQTAGRSELKAKSVAIEAVRVITDDNPLPPGLHRKTIEVITPGRKIRFTAATGARHETWFNALSYLLLRTQEEKDEPQPGDQLTREDVEEFNPGYAGRSHSRATGSRVSLSSYNSRATQNTAHRVGSRLSVRQATVPGATETVSTRDQGAKEDNLRQGSISRLSNMFKPSAIRGSFSSKHSRVSQAGDSSIYNASVVEDSRDSAEDLRKVIEKQEREADRLENVRACCDGKHDVSSLSHGKRHKHGSLANRSHSQPSRNRRQ